MNERPTYAEDTRGFFNLKQYEISGSKFRPLEICNGHLVTVNSRLSNIIRHHRETQHQPVNPDINKQIMGKIGKSSNR